VSDRERGFIVLHRRLQSWPLWKAMTGNQRIVWVQMLLAANWSESEVWISGKRVVIPRGSFIDTQETIAKDAGVSRKVVRQTTIHLEAEGAISRAAAGLQMGHGVILTTIVNYGKYQDVSDPGGRDWAAEGAAERATRGPEEGRGRAPSEQDQPEEPSLSPRELGAKDRRTIVGLAEALHENYPATNAVLGRLNDQGIPMRHAGSKSARDSAEAAIALVTTDVAVTRAVASFRENGRTTIGWHIDAIRGLKNGKGLRVAPPPIDQDESWCQGVVDVNRWRTVRANIAADNPASEVPRLIAEAKARFIERSREAFQ
jgi:hypothetical protein